MNTSQSRTEMEKNNYFVGNDKGMTDAERKNYGINAAKNRKEESEKITYKKIP